MCYRRRAGWSLTVQRLKGTYFDCAYIEEMEYQWDVAQARSNLRKHGIDFADAVGVFEDEWAFTRKEEEVVGEFRFATLGMDFLGRIVRIGATLSA